ncbi:MAG: hypothetical protein GXY49_04120 [Syntrophomonadaceae bacterium]|nr:hypothetical protein [Syntrophomonadaceae bacterium]
MIEVLKTWGMLYVFRCAVYYASDDIYNPELLTWWNWKEKTL